LRLGAQPPIGISRCQGGAFRELGLFPAAFFVWWFPAPSSRGRPYAPLPRRLAVAVMSPTPSRGGPHWTDALAVVWAQCWDEEGVRRPFILVAAGRMEHVWARCGGCGQAGRCLLQELVLSGLGPQITGGSGVCRFLVDGFLAIGQLGWLEGKMRWFAPGLQADPTVSTASVPANPRED